MHADFNTEIPLFDSYLGLYVGEEVLVLEFSVMAGNREVWLSKSMHTFYRLLLCCGICE